MREMKDSGVEWIGKIPKTWRLERAKTCFTQRNEKGNDEAVLLSATQQYGMYPQSLLEGVVQTREDTDLQSFKTVHKNDYVISLRSFQGGFEISDYEGVCSPAYQVFYATKPIDHRYYKRLFKSDGFISKMNSLTVGIREGKNIMYSDFASSMIPIPSKEEQKHISDYLDRKCAAIDNIITKQEQIIEKLKEYKLSLITEAVTKGLNPDVETNDDEEWYASIAKNYEIIKLKHLCCKIADGTHFSPEVSDEGYPYITAADVHGKGIDYLKTKKINYEAYEELVKQGCRPEKGDVLVVKDGATTGRVGLMDDDNECVILSSVAMLHPEENILSEYLMYLMMSDGMQKQISLSMAGSAMPRTTLTKLMKYTGILPPLEEQKEIVLFLDKEVTSIENNVLIRERIIEWLVQYKKSLIYEVVTGKKEV